MRNGLDIPESAKKNLIEKRYAPFTFMQQSIDLLDDENWVKWWDGAVSLDTAVAYHLKGDRVGFFHQVGQRVKANSAVPQDVALSHSDAAALGVVSFADFILTPWGEEAEALIRFTHERITPAVILEEAKKISKEIAPLKSLNLAKLFFTQSGS
ncbi:hypothetical protein A2954_04475 [Candidatus Roizmanbacteria bacterium RIFCSPLOWO2_01_FULL_37_12]|uniref:Uncharacterized protein n=1 Tax=Candidatus Roizmanbacteria bacterium RIFCSPLOWO2_01_FULL_37_12 TaxID=1802056 RepID=A0A1F7IFW4_9BACT|nr:MAG: hypothetical protein A2954_04475 [Candidatus Roizmanbacteria bacterium RIFCSPLOWO2_01_FULL_37_12]